ncbi:hypothetical protein [Streptomyces sp. NPDC004230]
MSTILAGTRPTEQRVSNAGSGLLAAAFERHADALLTYIRGHNQLSAIDSYGVEDLASEVWLAIAENMDRVDARVLEFSWLRLTANHVINTSAVEVAEVPAGFTGRERVLAVEGTEDDEYALAPMEPVAGVGDTVFVGDARSGMGVGEVRYLLGSGVGA